MEWIISLIAGAIGGNGAGAALKKFSLGPLWNSVVGIIGGGGGAKIMEMIGALTGNGTADTAIGGAVGGGVLMTIIGLVKKAMAK